MDVANPEGAFKSMSVNLNGSVDVKGELELSISRCDHQPCVLRFDLEYQPRINSNSGVFNVWLDATLNFQRFKFDGCPFNVVVSYRTPWCKSRDGSCEIPQLHRLRDAVHETHMPFLDAWFPNRSEGPLLTNGAVRYTCDASTKTEWVEFDLAALSKKPLITQGADVFWSRLKEWKPFNDDRDFPGDYASVVPE